MDGPTEGKAAFPARPWPETRAGGATPVTGSRSGPIDRRSARRVLGLVVVGLLLAAPASWWFRLQPLASNANGVGPAARVGPLMALKVRPERSGDWYFTLENTSPMALTVHRIEIPNDPIVETIGFHHETNDGSLGTPFADVRLEPGERTAVRAHVRFKPCPMDDSFGQGIYTRDAPAHVLRYEVLGVQRTATVPIDLSFAWADRYDCPAT